LANFTEEEQRHLWQLYRDYNKEALGTDPALSTDLLPKLKKGTEWPELNAEAIDFSRIGVPDFQGGFVETVLQGNLVDLLPSGASSSARPQTAASQEETKQEKTNFDVVIKSYPSESKVKLIKEVKNILGIGLKEAKEQVEGVSNEPLVVSKAAPKEKADELLKKLQEVGAEVELQ